MADPIDIYEGLSVQKGNMPTRPNDYYGCVLPSLYRKGDDPKRSAAFRDRALAYFGPGGFLEKQGVMIDRRDPTVSDDTFAR